MRTLGVDYGLAKIGLAISDPTGLLAQGLSVLRRTSDEQAVEAIVNVIREYDVKQVVVGLPRHMNGSIGERAEQCQAFADLIEKAAGIPVHMYDERLTSVAAERMLIGANVRRDKRKKVVDEVAATLMLQGYLDRQSHQRDVT
ncbi:Holliday junction resolvase RuvX [Alicyclobacillus pomorum]|jgi:putative holliday junction resolvase|uniref:Holliday junction resolvase RuvX n=1 Tax=Alicyclobacillus pomorum TaxID=204470 RepID=UPI0003FB3A8D|nr:Holliday junction resolvase RuvX [Alicyclobacillus pomorum]